MVTASSCATRANGIPTSNSHDAVKKRKRCRRYNRSSGHCEYRSNQLGTTSVGDLAVLARSAGRTAPSSRPTAMALSGQRRSAIGSPIWNSSYAAALHNAAIKWKA
jgi:hypothetical protein